MKTSNNNLYSTFYQTQIYEANKNYSPISYKDSINRNLFTYKNINGTQSPPRPIVFQVPKQNQILIARTPSPSYNRRNFINLTDNTKFKGTSNSPVMYHRFREMNSIKETPQINYHPTRNISPQPLNLKNNNGLIHFYKNNPMYINIEQRAPRLVRTPEIKRNNNLNIVKSRNNPYNNKPYNNNSNISFNGNQNIVTPIIKNDTNIQLLQNKNGFNYLKNQNNINVIKFNDANNIQKTYENFINLENHNILNQNNDNIRKLNNSNLNQNYQRNLKIANGNELFRNNKYQNLISIKKTPNTQNIYYSINNISIKNYENLHVKNKTDINLYNYNNNNNQSFKNISNETFTNSNYKTNQNIPPNIQNHLKIIPIPQNKHIFHSDENGIYKRSFNNIFVSKLVPTDDFNVSEFKIIKQIGEGTFGKIYCVKWTKNNEFYALKKINLFRDELNSFQKRVKIVQNLVKNTGNNGLIKIYADKCIPQKRENGYYYYIVMELGGRDWEKEIFLRKSASLYYSEYELFEIILQLVKTLSLMQKNNVTHRDIKPQNILLCKNNSFKICDFDEAKIIDGSGPILQPVRGSEVYMSPILFYAYNNRMPSVLHNTYKSDVFSLGMTIYLAATLSLQPLCDIRELKDMNLISNIINNALINRYSHNLINLIIKTLQIDENLRCDFIELEQYILNVWPN